VLDKAGVKQGAVQVRFKGLEEPVVADAPHFMKSLDIDHARDGEVMIAYAMNGEVVPGWYATYWHSPTHPIGIPPASCAMSWKPSMSPRSEGASSDVSQYSCRDHFFF
jgi:hypothetical protein